MMRPVPEPSEFDLTLGFPLLSGPFKAHLTVADGFIEVRPAAPWLLSRVPMFRRERVDSGDVTVVHADSSFRRGLRIETVSGALDRFILIPFSPAEGAKVHAAMSAHSYTVGLLPARKCRHRAGDVVHHGDVLGRRRQDDGDKPEAPSDAYTGLRAMAFGAVGGGLAPPSDDHPNVSGVVVDVPARGGYATFVALTDNTTSMYTSVGGGTIGAGEHQNVAQATQHLLGAVEAHLSLFVEPDDQSFPAGGLVRFHLLSPSGPRRVDVGEDAFWGRAQSSLMPVIAATQQVIAAIQSASPR